MGLKSNLVITVIVLVGVALCLPKPRDSTALHEKNHVQIEVEPLPHKHVDVTDNETPGTSTFSRIHCEHEEPIEDPVCQEHCLPKGYSYGLCISKTCSCV